MVINTISSCFYLHSCATFTGESINNGMWRFYYFKSFTSFITQPDYYLLLAIFHFIADFLLQADNQHPSQHVYIGVMGFNSGLHGL